MILYSDADVTGETLKFLKEKFQGILEFAFYILIALSILAVIICGIGLTYSKNNPEKRKQWIHAFVIVIIALGAVWLAIGLINVFQEKYKPELKKTNIKIILYYLKYLK